MIPRPGYAPPGAAGGDYGLRRRPFFGPGRPPPDDGSTDASYSEDEYSEHSSYPSATVNEPSLVTPQDSPRAPSLAASALNKLPVSAGTEDALARAQGEQQNEIGRYLTDMATAMDAGREAQRKELETLHDDIGRIRDQLATPRSTTAKDLPATPVTVAAAPQVAAEAPSVKASPAGPAAITPAQPQMATMTISEHSHDSPTEANKREQIAWSTCRPVLSLSIAQRLPRIQSRIECSTICKPEVRPVLPNVVTSLTRCAVADLMRRLDAPKDRDHLVERTHITEREKPAPPPPAAAMSLAPASVAPPVSDVPPVTTISA